MSGPLESVRRLWGLIVAASLVILGASGAFFVTRSPRPPKLVAEPSVLIIQAENDTERQRDVTVELRNVGDGSLRITEVRTSCGCTQAAPLPTGTLEGGASVPLKLLLHLPEPGSEKTVNVQIRTDNGLQEIVNISLKLRGRPLEPPYIEHVRPEFVQATATSTDSRVKTLVKVLSYETAAEEPWVLGLKIVPSEFESRLLERKLTEVHGDGTVVVVSTFEVSGPCT